MLRMLVETSIKPRIWSTVKATGIELVSNLDSQLVKKNFIMDNHGDNDIVV